MPFWGNCSPLGALNPLIQPTNVGEAGRRPRPALLVATKDRKLSRGRLQLISPSLGRTTLLRPEER